MALGEITKQFAKQALGEQVQGVIDSVVKPEAKPAAPDLGAAGVVIQQVQMMQRACKEDQELVVSVAAGAETLRVRDIYVPSAGLLVFTGMDAEGNLTRVVSPVGSAQIVCKVVKCAAGAVPHRVGVLLPKA